MLTFTKGMHNDTFAPVAELEDVGVTQVEHHRHLSWAHDTTVPMANVHQR